MQLPFVISLFANFCRNYGFSCPCIYYKLKHRAVPLTAWDLVLPIRFFISFAFGKKLLRYAARFLGSGVMTRLDLLEGVRISSTLVVSILLNRIYSFHLCLWAHRFWTLYRAPVNFRVVTL